MFGLLFKRILDARLIDCVELLEDMEEKGLLNMDKVSRSFLVCSCNY